MWTYRPNVSNTGARRSDEDALDLAHVGDHVIDRLVRDLGIAFHNPDRAHAESLRRREVRAQVVDQRTAFARLSEALERRSKRARVRLRHVAEVFEPDHDLARPLEAEQGE